jgi:diguanylate cyclase (GGDEF)-like protein/PAS domain S-box-containing protein
LFVPPILPQYRSRTRHRLSLRGFRLLAVAAVLIPAIWFGCLAAYDRARLVNGLADEVRIRTDILYQHALNVFETHQLAADRIADMLAGKDWDEIARSGSLRAALQAIRAQYPQIQGIWLVDSAGIIRLAADVLPPKPIGLGGRDYFRALQSGAAEYSLGGLVRGAVSGATNFNFGRRLQGPDGSFKGAVVTTVYPAYFTDFWTSVAPLPFMTTGLDRGDRMIMMRLPAVDPEAALLPATSVFARHVEGHDRGSFRDNSVFDGIERLYSFRKLGRYDAYILHGVGVETALQAWRQDLVIDGVVAIFSAAFLLGFAMIALHGAEREQAAQYLAIQTEQSLAAEAARRDAAEAHAAELQRVNTGLAAAERAARASEAQFRILAEHSSDAIIRTGIDGIRRYVSPSIFRLTGYPPEELVGRPWMFNVHPDDVAIAEDAFARLLGGAASFEYTIRLLRKDGPVTWIEALSTPVCNPATGLAEEIVTVARDITARKQAEATMAAAVRDLARQAATDPLTGLANRRCFDETLEREWRRAGRDGRPLALLMLDVDCFKSYNDDFGHQTGDTVLREVASCMQGATRRPGDTAARYGGEEFAVILPNTHADGAVQVAEAIRMAVANLALPHPHGPAGRVTISIGVAAVTTTAYPTLDTTPDSLIASADAALYAAKAAGRNRTVRAAAAGGFIHRSTQPAF